MRPYVDDLAAAVVNFLLLMTTPKARRENAGNEWITSSIRAGVDALREAEREDLLSPQFVRDYKHVWS